MGILPRDGHQPDPITDADEVTAAATGTGRTLSGVQKKWLVYRSDGKFLPSADLAQPAPYIAKFNRSELPTIVQNEDLSLRLAREVLGPGEITQAKIGRVEGVDDIALIVERFDRDGRDRLRLEDFAQILQKPRGREFDGKYNSSYEEAATVITQFSERARIDLDRYFRLVVFNLVIGNADAHLKNFSLLERKEGLRLSPAYDLLNTLVYTDLDRLTALAIGGSKRPFDTLDRSLVARLGEDIGLPRRAVDSALDQLAKRFQSAVSLKFSDNVQPDDFRIRYRDVVEDHAARIFS